MGSDDKLVVQGKRTLDARVDLDDHTESYACILYTQSLSRPPEKLIRCTAAWSSSVTLTSSLNIMVVCEMRVVHSRVGVGSDGIGNEVAECRSDDKYGTVGSEEDIVVLAVGLEGGIGANYCS